MKMTCEEKRKLKSLKWTQRWNNCRILTGFTAIPKSLSVSVVRKLNWPVQKNSVIKLVGKLSGTGRIWWYLKWNCQCGEQKWAESVFTLDKCWNVWKLCALSGLSRCVLWSDRRAGWGSGLLRTPRLPSLPCSRCWRPAPEPFSRPSLVRPSTQRQEEVNNPSVSHPDESTARVLNPSPPLSSSSWTERCAWAALCCCVSSHAAGRCEDSAAGSADTLPQRSACAFPAVPGCPVMLC